MEPNKKKTTKFFFLIRQGYAKIFTISNIGGCVCVHRNERTNIS